MKESKMSHRSKQDYKGPLELELHNDFGLSSACHLQCDVTRKKRVFVYAG